MTEPQRLYLVQAQTDFQIFSIFLEQGTTPQCHTLHYLQMATEKLGKASAWKSGPVARSHRAFVPFLRSLSTNSKAQKQLGYEGKNAQWRHLLRKSIPLAEQIENLAPARAGDGPNPEYPWPWDAPTNTPIEFEFPVWKELMEPSPGRQFLAMLAKLFDVAEAYV